MKKVISPLLLLIVFLGFFIRFCFVGSVPAGLNRDEASIGYTAYSLLKTAKDEYGTFLPLSIKSFGDWKLPLYVYLTVLPVNFSLSQVSVRLPSILIGCLSILTLYYLTLELFKKNTNRHAFALLASFLFSISPWHIHFSRVASEANVSIFLFIFALLLFFKGLRRPFLLYISAVVFSLTLYTYHASHIFTPLFIIVLIITLIAIKKSKKEVIIFFSIFILLASCIYQKTLFGADKTKISGLTPLSDKYQIYDKLTISRLEHNNPASLISIGYHNKVSYLLEKVVENYFKSFSTEFLFITGGKNLQHNIPNFGNLYIFESLFIVLGLIILFTKKEKWRYLLLFWFVISPIPASITKDAPHSARMLCFLPLPHLLASFGIIYSIKQIKKKGVKNIASFIFTVLVIFNVSVYLDRYFIHFPIQSEFAWGGGYKELVDEIAKLKNKYPQIVVDRPEFSPYIYYLFYEKYDPSTFQKNALRYDIDEEGYHHVRKIENIEFKKIDFGEDLLKPGRLLASHFETTPKNATSSAVLIDKLTLKKIENRFDTTFGLKIGDRLQNNLVKTIKLKNGQPVFYLIEIQKVESVPTSKDSKKSG